MKFNVHGVSFSIFSEDQKFLNFVQHNYSYFRESDTNFEDADINITFNGYCNKLKNAHRKKIDIGAMHQIGTGIYYHNSSLMWRNSLYDVSISFRDQKLFIECSFSERIDHTFRRIILQQHNYLFQNYQAIMRTIVHYPVFWWLARNKNIRLIHASAVERNEKAFIFSGLNGCGKSTLASHLWLNSDFKLLSDNFLLFDQNTVYTFPELLRLDSAYNNDPNGVSLKPMDYPLVYGKRQYLPNATQITEQAIPTILMFVSIGPKTSLEPLSTEKVLPLLHKSFDFLGENTEHTIADFIDLIAPKNFANLDGTTYFDALSLFVDMNSCYRLSIGRNEPSGNTADVIQKIYQEL